MSAGRAGTHARLVSGLPTLLPLRRLRLSPRFKKPRHREAFIVLYEFLLSGDRTNRAAFTSPAGATRANIREKPE